MGGNIKRVHPPAFKSRVAVEAIKEQKTIAQISSQFSVHPTQITKWKRSALEAIDVMFSSGKGIKSGSARDDDLMKSLYEQIGQLKVESDFLKKKIGLIEG